MLKGQVSGPKVPEEYEKLVAPHVASYDYFLGEGMQMVVNSLPPIEVRIVSQYCQYRYSNAPHSVATTSIKWAALHSFENSLRIATVPYSTIGHSCIDGHTCYLHSGCLLPWCGCNSLYFSCRLVSTMAWCCRTQQSTAGLVGQRRQTQKSSSPRSINFTLYMYTTSTIIQQHSFYTAASVTLFHASCAD